MPIPTGFRKQALLYMELADKEPDPNLRRSLASRALALAQLAEEIEREESHIQIIADAIVRDRQQRQQQPEFAPLEAEPAARKIVERLASAGYKIVPVSY
jgi:hypothetical protein